MIYLSEQKKKILLAAVGGVLLLFLFVGGCAAMSKSKPAPTPTPPSSSSSEVESEPSSAPEPEPEKKPEDVVIPAALTRGEFAALLANKLNVTVENDAKNVFPDMESHFAKKPVLALLQLGILSEDDYGGSFAPKIPITRIEAIKMLVIAMDGEADADKFVGNTSFADDSKIPQELKGYAATAEALELPVRFANDTLRPYAFCVREEAVALIAKLNPKKLTIVGGETTEGKKEESSKPSTKPTTPSKPAAPTKPIAPTKPTTPAAAAKVSFELPKTAHTDTKIELKSGFENTTKLAWELKQDGRTVNLSSYVDGDPSKDSTITFEEKGVYELTLKATGKDGKVVTVSRKTTIHPEIQLEVSIPTKADIDENVDVKLHVYGNEDEREIQWKLRRNNRTVDLDDYADENLYDDGGDISFHEDGRYELIATVKDKTGRVFSGKDTITVKEGTASSKPDTTAPTFSFDLPATAHTDTTIAVHAQGTNMSGYEVSWELYTTKGLETNLRAFVEGTLDKNGGSIRFTQAGIYELQAVIKNSGGTVLRVKSGKIEVFPVLAIDFKLPAEGKTDKKISVRTTGNSPLPLNWSLTKDGKNVNLSDYTTGELTNAGGDLRFTEQGVYTLKTAVTDVLERTFTATHSINIYEVEEKPEPPVEKPDPPEEKPEPPAEKPVNRAPEKPTITFACVGISTPYGTEIAMTAQSSDPDDDALTYEWLGRKDETAYYQVGQHTIRVRAIDPSGAASEWYEFSFTVPQEGIPNLKP